MLACSVCAFAWYVATLLQLTSQPYATPWVAHGAAVWLVVNAALVIFTLRRTTARHHNSEQRGGYRFPSDATAEFGGRPCTITDLSMTGARLRRSPLTPHALDPGALVLGHHGDTVELAATIVNRDASGDGTVGIVFDPGQYTALAELAEMLFHDTRPDERVRSTTAPATQLA